MRTYIRRHHYICGTTVISLLFSVTSCSTVRVDELSPSTDWIHHVVHADQRGRLQTKYFPNGHCGSEQNDDYNDSEERYLALVDCHNQSIINNLATYTSQTSKPKILIFIHGGLNEDIDTLKRAIRDTPRLMDDGYYPIFFNWHSDGPGAYRDQVLNVRQGNLHNDTRGRITRMLSAPLYVLSDALEAVAGAPAVWFNQMFNPDEPYIGYEDEHWVENSQPLRSWDDVSHRNNVIFDDSPYDPYITPSHLAQLAITWPVRLVTAPAVDSFGTEAWDNMERTTQALLRWHGDFAVPKDEGLTCPEHPECRKGTGAFASFAHQLEKPIVNNRNEHRQNPDVPLVEVNLVAHSMGTIIANDMVRDFDLDYDNIVYMGAATSISHFYNTVVPYIVDKIEEQSVASPDEAYESIETRFYNLMLHPDAENRETYAGATVPQGSLLEWIDDMYEESNSHMERTLGKWVNVEAVKFVFPADIQKRMIFRVFGMNLENPLYHSDFDAIICMENKETSRKRTYLRPNTQCDGDITYNYWNPKHWGAPEFIEHQPERVR